MKPNKKILIGSIIFTIIFFILTVISTYYGKDYPSPEGRVLTAEFVKMYSTHRLYDDLSTGSLILSFCGIAGIVAAFIWDIVPTTRRDMTGPVLLIVAIFFVTMVFRRYTDEVFVLATKEPYVRPVTVTDRFESSYRRSKHYYLVMSNGVNIRVNSSEFKYYKNGDEFYLIMCGKSCVGYFDATDYILP